MPGSATAYPKRGMHTKVSHDEPGKSERLVSRMMLCQNGPVPAERRAMGDYALQPRAAAFDKSPRNGTDDSRETVRKSGIASRGNVIHTRYLVGM